MAPPSIDLDFRCSPRAAGEHGASMRRATYGLLPWAAPPPWRRAADPGPRRRRCPCPPALDAQPPADALGRATADTLVRCPCLTAPPPTPCAAPPPMPLLPRHRRCPAPRRRRRPCLPRRRRCPAPRRHRCPCRCRRCRAAANALAPRHRRCRCPPIAPPPTALRPRHRRCPGPPPPIPAPPPMPAPPPIPWAAPPPISRRAAPPPMPLLSSTLAVAVAIETVAVEAVLVVALGVVDLDVLGRDLGVAVPLGLLHAANGPGEPAAGGKLSLNSQERNTSDHDHSHRTQQSQTLATHQTLLPYCIAQRGQPCRQGAPRRARRTLDPSTGANPRARPQLDLVQDARREARPEPLLPRTGRGTGDEPWTRSHARSPWPQPRVNKDVELLAVVDRELAIRPLPEEPFEIFVHRDLGASLPDFAQNYRAARKVGKTIQKIDAAKDPTRDVSYL